MSSSTSTSTSKGPSTPTHCVVLGAGVIGLTTALCLWERYPGTEITILARHFPGDYHVDYASPWAGANWCPSSNDNGVLEHCDRVTYERFAALARTQPQAGISFSPLRMVLDMPVKETGLVTPETGKVWFEDLVGGFQPLEKSQLPPGAVFGMDMERSFAINTQIYLQWLLARCRDIGAKLVRKQINHIDEAWLSPRVDAVFNCSGLGSHRLGGVDDKTMYPTRGQTVLVEQPIEPLRRLYFRSPRRVDNDTTYVFQRPLGGGVVLGGCREDGNWDGRPDQEFAKQIMRRCCELVPELGRPEDLKVIRHGVGLRPSRRAGPRMEAEVRKGKKLVIHSYGASGAGYQASWGMAAHAVDQFRDNFERAASQKAKL